jgi:lipid-A-disaccharide synthase
VQRANFFIFAGEASGDLHGAHLMKAMKLLRQDAHFQGVGGEKMAQQRLHSLFPFEKLQVMGFTDVMTSLPTLYRCLSLCTETVLQGKPEACILIDYQGFNIKLAQELKKKGYKGKIILYVSPSVWAWGRSRIQKMEKAYDLVLSILPFEPKFYEVSSLPAVYVGNPLIELVQSYTYDPDWKKKAAIPENKKLIALFPGSRPAEIEKNLPLQLQAVKKLLDKDPNLHVVVSLKDKTLLPDDPRFSLLPKAYHYECMKECSGAIAKSGTITLELALHGTPFVVTYPVGGINYLIAKYILQLSLKNYCLANILLNETVYPEWIGYWLDSTTIANSLEEVMRSQKSKEASERLKQILGSKQASLEAAKTILDTL